MSGGEGSSDFYSDSLGASSTPTNDLKQQESKRIRGNNRRKKRQPYPSSDTEAPVERIIDKWIGPDADSKVQTFYLVKFRGFRIPAKKYSAAYNDAWIPVTDLTRDTTHLMIQKFESENLRWSGSSQDSEENDLKITPSTLDTHVASAAREVVCVVETTQGIFYALKCDGSDSCHLISSDDCSKYCPQLITQYYHRLNNTDSNHVEKDPATH